MKVKKLVSALALGLVSCSSLLISGCFFDSTSYNDSPQTPVPPPPVTTIANSYQVVLKDAATGELIADDLQLKFSGAAALKASNGSVLNDTTVTVSSGLFALGATFTATATDFSVQVVDAAGNGWVSGGVTVTGAAGQTGVSSVILSLVNTKSAGVANDSPAPLAITVSTGATDATGAITATVSATTPAKTITLDDGSTATVPAASVTLAAGTVAKTASGAPAAAGALTVASVAYSTATSAGLASIPGGYSANAAGAPDTVLKGADPTKVAFVPAGFAQFSVTDSAGNAITSFDPPVSVSIDVPKTTKGADGTPVTAGMTIPIWSFNQATGAWTYEQTGTIAEKSPVDADNFTIPFTTAHLSSWQAAELTDTCSVKVNVPAGVAPLLEVGLSHADDIAQIVSESLSPTASSAQFLEVPNIAGQVLVSSNHVIIGQKSVASFCTGDVTFTAADLTTPPPVQFFKVVVNVTEACADGSQKRGLATSVNINNAYFGYSTVTTGELVGTATFDSVPVSDGAKVFVQNPRTGAFDTAATTGGKDGETVTVPVNFTMTCATGG